MPSSPSGWNARWLPHGATMIGVGHSRPEERDAHVEPAHVDEPPRPDVDALQRRPVPKLRLLAVDPGLDVAEVGRRHGGGRHPLHVEDVERVAGLRGEGGGGGVEGGAGGVGGGGGGQ